MQVSFNQEDDAEDEAHLLNPGNVLSDVLDADGVLDSQTVRLALDTGFVNEDTAIGSKTCSVSYGPGYAKSGEDHNSPAKAMQTWSSSIATFLTVLGSCSCRADFFSTPSTTTSDPFTPTCHVS